MFIVCFPYNMNDNFVYHSLKLDPSVMDPSVMALIENPTSVPEYIAATAHVENTSHPSTIPATTTHSTELGIDS